VPQGHLGLSLHDFMQRDRDEEKHEETAVLSAP
jgi:hypothetical protein